MHGYWINISMNTKKKIFVGLTELCGYYGTLKKALEELGEDVTFVNVYEHPFRYSVHSYSNPILKMLRFFTKSRVESLSRPVKLLCLLGEMPLRFILLIWAVCRFDVFIFSSNCTFFRFLELPLLKLCGKKTICVFTGSDSRPYYISGLTYSADLNSSIDQCIWLSGIQKKTMRWVERFADIIINHPPSAHFLERPFIQWLRIGIPQDLSRSLTSPSQPRSNRAIRVVHAPSRPECKGTARFRKIIKKMKDKGIAIDFIELMGRPNQEVLQELSQCDFVIDELYSDTPMAVLASEAAIFAKPSVIGGYLTPSDLGDLPSGSVPPSVYVRPDKAEEAIERLLVDEEYRAEAGKKAAEFLKNQWSAQAVAQRFQMLINGTYPQEWLYQPQNIRYLYGWGLSEAKCKELLQAVIKKGGIEALQLHDKPELERAFLEFADISK